MRRKTTLPPKPPVAPARAVRPLLRPNKPEPEAAPMREEVNEGVSVHWLRAVFRMSAETIATRLATCPVMRIEKGNVKRYDLATAAAYLVDPKTNLDKYIMGLRPEQLPPMLQPTIWRGRLHRQEWETKAGDLWHTSRVESVLAETFATMRNSMEMWLDEIEREGYETKVVNKLRARVDELREDIHTLLVKNAKKGMTESQIAEVNEIFSQAPLSDD